MRIILRVRSSEIIKRRIARERVGNREEREEVDIEELYR